MNKSECNLYSKYFTEIMDLTQCKLTAAEWDSTEIPPSLKEQQIMRMIMDGYTNLDICVNHTQTLLGFLKMEQSEHMDKYLYDRYIIPKFIFGNLTNTNPSIKNIHATICKISTKKTSMLRSADKIRIQNADSLIHSLTPVELNDQIYEFFLVNQIVSCVYKNVSGDDEWQLHYFTLAKMHENMQRIVKLNTLVVKVVEYILQEYNDSFEISYIIFNAAKCIEQNKALLKYKNEQLYNHQKELFALVKQPEPKLILYIAPTGTGKTLSPIGMGTDKKIIFVCAARHVGLALAKMAISVDKKIAFAFGATCADDVRLHYAAAKDYTKHKKSGRIKKVDNTKGEKVEIIICDIRSYLPAMYYMLAFNAKEDIIMYWDEVTISMDYEEHPLHEMIRNVWRNNLIPNIVFSSATVPSMDDLGGLRASFGEKCPDGEIHTIHSYDCVKSISILDNTGCVVLPHLLFDKYDELQKTIEYWKTNGTIMRYFDAQEVGNLLQFIETKTDTENLVKNSGRIRSNFHSYRDVDMTQVKLHYMRTLLNIIPEKWAYIYNHFQTRRTSRLTATTPPTTTAGVFITTKDAHTLTDGPTYFFTDDVAKIALFYVQQSNIPTTVMDTIMTKIDQNNTITKKVEELENAMNDISKENEESREDTKGKGKKNVVQDIEKNPKIGILQSQIDVLRAKIQSVKLHDLFVPNKPEHLKKWFPEYLAHNSLYFTSNVTDDIVVQIMKLPNIDNTHKILLLMGIGVFKRDNEKSLNPAYLEIMKSLASQQKLYMIIAESDYFWGTNYQACHAYFSKDLILTQDKILQGMGRVGRGNIQQNYTIRFRDPAQIRKLLCALEPEEKMEVVNINKLFGPSVEDEERTNAV